MNIQEHLNNYRGGQLLSLSYKDEDKEYSIYCKLEMKVYNTIALPITIDEIIVSLVDETGHSFNSENFYEKKIKVDAIQSIAPL